MPGLVPKLLLRHTCPVPEPSSHASKNPLLRATLSVNVLELDPPKRTKPNVSLLFAVLPVNPLRSDLYIVKPSWVFRFATLLRIVFALEPSVTVTPLPFLLAVLDSRTLSFAPRMSRNPDPSFRFAVFPRSSLPTVFSRRNPRPFRTAVFWRTTLSCEPSNSAMPAHTLLSSTLLPSIRLPLDRVRTMPIPPLDRLVFPTTMLLLPLSRCIPLAALP